MFIPFQGLHQDHPLWGWILYQHIHAPVRLLSLSAVPQVLECPHGADGHIEPVRMESNWPTRSLDRDVVCESWPQEPLETGADVIRLQTVYNTTVTRQKENGMFFRSKKDKDWRLTSLVACAG